MDRQTAPPLAAALAALVFAAPAVAQSWEFQITPYAWLSGIDGDIGAVPVPGVPPQSVELSFGDVWDVLDYAGMLYATARYDRWVLLFDGTTAKLKDTVSVNGPVVDNLTVKSTVSNLALAVGRTVTTGPDYRVDVYAGGRAWWLDNTFEVETTPAAGLGTITKSSDASWVDPILGVAGNYRLAERWELFGAADIGGFGVGADVEWNLLAGANYLVSDRFALTAGFRALYVDYDEDGIVYDVTQAGPLLGASFRF
jgi:hypothetical protein